MKQRVRWAARVLLVASTILLFRCSTAHAQLTISSMSPTSGPVGSSVTLSGLNFGVNQGTSTVSLNGTPAPVVSWSDTSIIAIVPSGAPSGTFAVTVNSDVANSAAFTVTGLPSGWTDADIGTVGVAGSGSYANGIFTTQGAGSWSFSGSSDAINFAYQNLSGDGTVQARIVGISGSSSTMAGIEMRETLNANSTYAAVTAHSTTPYFLYRTTTAASSSYQAYSSTNLPYWVRLVRSGNTFTSYISANGVVWNQIGSTQTISMATNIYAGLAVSSESTSSLATVTFDNLSVNTTSTPAPAITTLSATTGPVGTQVVISGSGFGDTQNGSTATISTAPMIVNSWSATSITATIPPGATTGSILVSVAPTMADSNGVVFTVTSQPLPSGWLDSDVGATGPVGSSTFNSSAFTVSGSGSWSFGSTSEAMHFVYQPLSGDGSIIARVVSRTTSSTVVGVMVRETLTGGSRCTATAYDSYPFFEYRATTGSSSSDQYSSSETLPYWLELVRNGNSFSSYTSPDGVNWTQIGTTQTITMVTNVYIGLAVASNSTTALATATFDNVSISTPSVLGPIITSLSATTGPVGSQVAIFGSGFGASQNGSVATLGGLPLTVQTWSDTAIQATIPSGATTGPIVVSVAPTMNDSNYVVFTVTSQPLAPGWLDTDIGQVGNAGTATYANGTFTVNGGGDWYFQEGSDAMHFAYQPLSGDGSIIARIVSRSTSSTVAGVMIRETLQANSRFASMEYNSYPYFVYRTSTGGSSTYANHSAVTLPYWVELVRSGSSFTSYISPDGVNWTQVGSTQTISMATNVYIGLAVASNSTTALANATFDNVSINSALVPAPVIASMSATTGAVGTPVTINGSGFGTSQSGSMVVLNGTSLPVTAWSSTSVSVTIPSGATSGPLLVSVAPSMNDSNYVIFTVESQPLPTGLALPDRPASPPECSP